MCTDNPILVRNTMNLPTIVCMQRKADKKIVEEDDIIAANKLAFNDDIGTITNYVTSMFEVQAGFDPESEEYKVLEYRIKCGELYQQNSIDRAKGIIAKPMPSYWYNLRDLTIHDDDDEETIAAKEFNKRVAAYRKPYFMIYVYPTLKKEYGEFVDIAESRIDIKYHVDSIKALAAIGEKTEDKNVLQTLAYYQLKLPAGNNPCLVNRICWIFEKEFKGFTYYIPKLPEFDYRFLRSTSNYPKTLYNIVKQCYAKYYKQNNHFAKTMRSEKKDADYAIDRRLQMIQNFKKDCAILCANENDLCDIVLDICYSSEGSKQFAWDTCGDVIVRRILMKNEYKIQYPMIVDSDGEFVFCGKEFKMKTITIPEAALEHCFE